ncbi:MAG TPA: TlpA disulfide reductase family protein [Mycobacteriales bacterium]|nr:TlpA disulfide reductase family protein [Mycobacteriales bacterium]
MRQAFALLGASVVLVAACGGGNDGPRAEQDLAPLRAAAALAPCPAAVGDVPSLTLPCLGGGPDVRLDGAATGVPTLVNVYGSWCGPCQKEMPVLAAFARRAGSKVALLGVDTEDEARLALLFARDVGQHWPAVVDDEGTFMRHYGPGPPLTLFVDRAGKVAFVHRGPFASLGDLVAAVSRRLGVAV